MNLGLLDIKVIGLKKATVKVLVEQKFLDFVQHLVLKDSCDEFC